MEIAPSGTVSDYIASIAKQHAPVRKKFFSRLLLIFNL
jgi:hypothetical protein